MNYFQFVHTNRRFLSFGILVAFFSAFGQTFFIAVFGPDIRAEFGLSHGGFGGYYAIGTAVSGFCLIWAGKLIDRFDLRWVTAGVATALILACAFMSVIPAAWALAPALFALRISGQGLMSHTAMTAMGRYFDAERGRAVSIAILGFPAGVAVFPGLAVWLSGQFGWRMAWAAVAVTLAVFLIPLLLWLLKGHGARHRFFLAQTSDDDHTDDAALLRRRRRQWTRAEVLRDPRFYLLCFAITAPSFISTGLFFHQAHLAAAKGWTLAWLASAFVAYTVGAIGANLAFGPMIDRYGARRLLPYYLYPLVFACLTIVFFDHPLAAVALTLFLGLTSGSGQTLVGAAWPEFYGVLHLGAIRAMVMSMSVGASALSPFFLGWLIDRGVSMETISMGFLVYLGLAIVGILFALARPVPIKREGSTS
ncbi:MAG: MFS transporter [Rhodospirillaceae bacterium]|jgi:MFS family permease|nr:MFS transporter [Rhodospirillaceae bacterium]MBT4489354.1 MFS transporter [Rhodospirillaceae bacterium]MBT5194226.1 MFS transporter [Rhodospirillaceae bacterium]MBT5897916.1 MFS transporter [Rhodospirillaceae bacterium]MBT6429764.1 MFS transporter [Rhodospirillaceae bacterium]